MSASSPKIFAAADLSPLGGIVPGFAEIGQRVEFWLDDGSAGAIGELTGIFPDSPLPQIEGAVALVHVPGFARFALPLDRCRLVPAASPLAAGIVPPPRCAPDARGGGFHETGEAAHG